MTSALIGYSGFVGSNLLRQRSFDALFNSKNIEDIKGQHFDVIVSAGGPAEKWKANQNPEADRAALTRLQSCLAEAKAQKLILVSTIDVYPAPVGVDEATAIAGNPANPYGQHRYELERFLSERFDTLILRLPALFGRGLKKNAIYDLLHDNQVEKIHADGQFQFYWLEHLWADVQTALRNSLKVLNVATEPVKIHEVAREAFGLDFQNRPAAAPARYDMRSRHAALFGGANGYLYDRATVLKHLRLFVHEERNPGA